MTLVRWKRFTWDAAALPPSPPVIDPHYRLRTAEAGEAGAVKKMVLSAFSLDSSWGEAGDFFLERLVVALDRSFGDDVSCVVVTHGQRIIAASALASAPDAENHLLSGPCVLSEYRNRGIGSALLYQSLLWLRNVGVTKIRGVTRDNIPTSKFLYPKFGAVAAVEETEMIESAK